MSTQSPRKYPTAAGSVLAALAGLSLALTGCAAQAAKESAPAPSASAAAATPSAEAKKTLASQFVRVIDGDTIEVQPQKKGQPTGEPNVKVRMLGITAPDASACGGAESIANLKSLFAPNEQVTVTYEPTLDEAVDEDGNTLAYVIIGAGIINDVGLLMVQDGFAAASYPEGKAVPKKYDWYASEGQGAVDRKIGIWASCPTPKV